MRVPPPVLENGLRPSSALRALSAPASSGIEIRDRLRLEHRGIHPGLDRLRIAAGHRLLRGDAAERAGSIAPQSRAPAAAQPLPVPSGVRAVTDRSASVVRWYANRPLLVATARVRAFASRKPATNDVARRPCLPHRGVDGALDRVGARFGIEVGGRSMKASTVGVRLRAELRHQLGILGRQPRERARPGRPSASATHRRARWSRPTRGAARS